MTNRRAWLTVVLLLIWWRPGLLAQRALHWDALDVEASLDADGILHVTETQTIVFTGDWNGGERAFNIRPRQTLRFLGMDRVDAATGARRPLEESPVPDDVDEFSLADSKTVRWRSRLPGDPPFANTRLTYVLRYELSGILQTDGEQYRLDHDFAFPDRDGPISRFSLKLALDPTWTPLGSVQERYTAGPIPPGRSFVVTSALRYAGSGVPLAIDTRRPPAIVAAVAAVLAWFALGVLALVVREKSLGRFAPLPSVDGAWVEQHILTQPAEVVGAAWDDSIGTSEVVALIARMTGEGKLESRVTGTDEMTLGLKVDRSRLSGHELALVEGLFFDGRSETSTAAVKAHYTGKGFDPSKAIQPALDARVKAVMPPGASHVWPVPGVALFVAGAGLLAWTAYTVPGVREGAVVAIVVFVLAGALLQIPGWLFRSRVDWGLARAAACLIPALIVSVGTVAFLWFVLGSGRLEAPPLMIAALTALSICITNASINSLKSRQSREAIAYRKHLAAGRRFFMRELEKPDPVLQDSWYPWLLSFGLGKQVDGWSTRHRDTRSSTWHDSTTTTSSSTSSSSGGTGWTGGGGASGGAGASATWAAAAAGMAAGVAAPSSSSSGGSSSSSSSGGGGGGGW